MSAKRRRSINIDISLIEGLEREAKIRGVATPTALASLIFLGEGRPLEVEDRAGKTKGVSMKESVHLSLRLRAESRGMSISATTQEILVGSQPPLTKSEVAHGESEASEREAKRIANGESLPKPKKKRESKKNPKKEKAETKGMGLPDHLEEIEERKLRHSKLPKGVPIEMNVAPARSALKELNQEENGEYLGGVYSL